MITEKDISEIQEKVQPLLGKRASKVHRTAGSFIHFDFGEIVTIDEDNRRGEWHLWVQHCAWRLQTDSEVLIASEDEQADVDLVLMEKRFRIRMTLKPSGQPNHLDPFSFPH